jgi:hypothetical protein
VHPVKGSHPTNKTTARIFIGALLLATFGCKSIAPGPGETLDWDLREYVLVYEEGSGWKGLGGEETRNRVLAPPGVTTEDWTVTLHIIELPIAITLGSDLQWDAENLMNAQKAALVEEGCADPWTILGSGANSILYERVDVACDGYLHDHEIGRFLVGDWFMWWISLRMRSTTLTAAERADLITWLEQARVAN